MSAISNALWQPVVGMLALVAATFAAVFAPQAIKDRLARWRWLWIGLIVAGLAWLFLYFLPRRYPPASFDASALPEPFRPAYWRWMFLLLLGVLGSGLGLLELRKGAKRAAGIAGAAGGEFPEIDAAWDEIRVRLDAAKIDPTAQRFYLLLSPSEESVAALIEAAGLQVFAQGPAGPAPIHAYATSDGVFLSCSGASHLGAPGDPSASARIAHLGKLLSALRPECPVLRGVVVLFPMDWCSRPESAKEAASVRDDLQVVLRASGVNCPFFAMFSAMETVPGFADFASRLGTQVSPQMIDQRVGFAVPSTQEFGGELVQRGLIWQSGWFHVWSLNLLAGEPLNYRGNAELVTLDAEFRRYRRRLRTILESAFSTHQGAEPIVFRGCYFVATGASRRDRAFAAGLFRGARSRVVADHVVSDWTEDAARSDRRYLRAAIAVGAVGLLTCLFVWFSIASRSPGLGWAGLIALILAWVAGLAWLFRSGARSAG